MRTTVPLRWVAITIFVLSGVLNYLDRQVLATMVDIWRARPEFPFDYSSYGLLLSVFSIAYAVAAPFMGWFIDRVGLNRSISISVAVWALASFGTGLVHGMNLLLVTRAILGVAEAAGVSAAGKATGMYLEPKERAVGTAMSQLGLSLGAGLAPQFAVFFAYRYSWRWAFFGAGLLSLAWIPLWLFTSRAIPPVTVPSSGRQSHSFGLVRDSRLWALVVANFVSMTIYSLWTNWPPTYLIQMHHLTPPEAKNYTWIVPICGYFGALLGGQMSWRMVSKGLPPVEARKRVCFISACILLLTMFIPLLPTPALATTGMSLSFFWIAAWSTNLYTIPVDLFGANRAAFGVSALVCAYGAMQAVISRPLGAIIENHGFSGVCFTFAFLPLAAYFCLKTFVRESQPQDQPALVASN
jgi:ACS family hexuronate transporter-like MFS transporter